MYYIWHMSNATSESNVEKIIFDCLSGRFGKVVFNLELSNLTDSDVASYMQLILELNSAHVKFDV